MSLDLRLQRIWYGGPSLAQWLLWPFSCLFGVVAAVRRWGFRHGLLRSQRVDKPVVVVGNITVGGTGKTPVVIWLAKQLAAAGHRPGIITRGYGGRARNWPQRVQPGSDPAQVGDEAVLIAAQTGALVMAGPDRVAAARQAIAAGADIILSDDGLQHYRLQRDCELVVVDASRLLGNGRLLPAGPLREPAVRLRQADVVLLNCRSPGRPGSLGLQSVEFRVLPTGLKNLSNGVTRTLDDFRGHKVHVVTGIGNPQAFIDALRTAGLQVDARILPDHAAFRPADIDFGDDLPVLMTEKDAVKCQALADSRHWAVGATLQFEAGAAERILGRVEQCIARRNSAR